jgi:hypothetical protein
LIPGRTKQDCIKRCKVVFSLRLLLAHLVQELRDKVQAKK